MVSSRAAAATAAAVADAASAAAAATRSFREPSGLLCAASRLARAAAALLEEEVEGGGQPGHGKHTGSTKLAEKDREEEKKKAEESKAKEEEKCAAASTSADATHAGTGRGERLRRRRPRHGSGCAQVAWYPVLVPAAQLVGQSDHKDEMVEGDGADEQVTGVRCAPGGASSINVCSATADASRAAILAANAIANVSAQSAGNVLTKRPIFGCAPGGASSKLGLATGDESRAAISASEFANVPNQIAAFANGFNQNEAVRAKDMKLALDCGKTLAHDGSQSVCSDVPGTMAQVKCSRLRM